MDPTGKDLFKLGNLISLKHFGIDIYIYIQDFGFEQYIPNIPPITA